MKLFVNWLIKNKSELYMIFVYTIGLAAGIYMIMNPSPSMLEALKEFGM